MSNKEVPIVFSTDDKYVMPTSVAITSLVSNYNGNKIVFFILSKEELKDESKKILEKSSKINENVSTEINYICVDESLFGDLKTHMGHITMATYYRLLIPDLLLKYDSCLYLDGDICVTGDVNHLFRIDLGENYVAGVLAFDIVNNRKSHKERIAILGIENLKSYINAGVLLMNLKLLREQGMNRQLIELAKKDFPVQDQDVINVGCYEKILIISPKFNAMPSVYNKKDCKLLKVYTKEQISEAKENPVIIHYASRYKPWDYYNVEKNECWDKYYKKLFGKVPSQRKSMKVRIIIDTWKYRFKNLINHLKK